MPDQAELRPLPQGETNAGILNRPIYLLRGDSPGWVSLLGFDGTIRDTDGSTLSTGNPSLRIQPAAGVPALLILDASGNLILLADEATRNATIGGNVAWRSGTVFAVTLDHAATANRTMTVQDLTGTMALLGAQNAGNFLFVDNTYDIGANGATRPRDLFLARNATIGGHLGVTVPGARVRNSGSISLTSGVLTALTYDSERYDTEAMHSTTVNPERLTIVTAGRYRFTAHVSFASNAVGQRIVFIKINAGGDIIGGDVRQAVNGDITVVTVTAEYLMAAGDYAYVEAYQTSLGALNVVAAAQYSPEFSASWVSTT